MEAASKSPPRSTTKSNDSWESWPLPERIELLRQAQKRLWHGRARPDQLEPEGEWRTWYIRGGRGSGKTRAGCETLAGWVLNEEPGDWAVIAPTYGDARDTCVEGPESGLLAVLGGAVATWNRSLGELRTVNGSRIHIDGADDGALRIQGKNLRGVWADEVGLWREWERAWHESIAFAVRLDPAKIVATGTPKGKVGIPKLLLDDEAIPVTRLRTLDNEANMSKVMLDALRERYKGTRLGRQELEGELLDDVEGALWTWDQIETDRVREMPELQRIVVGVDPAASANAESNETGIIVAGIDGMGHGYVMADQSGRYSPNVWAKRVVSAYEVFKADRIVPERNNGGDMVESTIRTVDPNVPVKPVWASRGKQTRAEPIAALYEQGKVHHVGTHPELESQLTGWVPGEGHDSPDRLDAMVWALSELMLGRNYQTNLDPVSVTGQSSWRS